jgi:AP-3 complex subunit delta-1
MFEKTLNDMIKGMRANPATEAPFVASCMAECRKELTSRETAVKQQAVLKLVYLQMLGHDVSWAAFHFVDVMASARFRGKRIGFLAAAETFTEQTDVLLLTTNLFRKAFASSTTHEASLALGCLSRFATEDLARDLIGDLSSMLASSRPLLRKKAVLALYKLLQKLPEALVQVFPRLREKLDDPDPSVVACTVNVLTELATDNPCGYLGLAPALYKVLTTSSSNWTLIKVVKFLRQLVPHEPRLARKLVQPLTHLITTTAAKSLQFECLYTVATTMAHSQPDLARLSAEKLRDFVESDDPNLKSLGLLALAALQTTDKALVEGCRDAVLRCLDDEPTVRTAALSLICGMVTRASLADLVEKLIGQVQGGSHGDYRDEVIRVVVQSVKADGFSHVASFRWLVITLFTVANLPSKHGVDVARLLLEVTLRVPTVRAFAVEHALEWLRRVDGATTTAAATATSASSATPGALVEAPADAALLAASFLICEHSSMLPLALQQEAIGLLLTPPLRKHSPEVQSNCVQAMVRALVQIPCGGNDDNLLAPLLTSTRAALRPLCSSGHPEVMERARGARALLGLLGGLYVGGRGAVDAAGADSPSRPLDVPGMRADLLRAVRRGLTRELRVVAPKAQRKVKPPPELDLSTPIYVATAADWAVLRPPQANHAEAARADDSLRDAAAATADTGDCRTGQQGAARASHRPSGPYYLDAGPKSARASPGGETSAGGMGACGNDGCAARDLATAGVVPGGADAPPAASCGASADAASDRRFGDEDDGAAIDLHEAMPDGAEESDDESPSVPPPRLPPPQLMAESSSSSTTTIQPAPLVDLLSTDVTGEAHMGEGGSSEGGSGRRRRRRKHRADGGAESGSHAADGADATAPLVTF